MSFASLVNSKDAAFAIPGGSIDRIFTPASVSELGDVVGDAAAGQASLVPMGGRTWLSLANEVLGSHVGVSLAGLSGIDEFEPDEGVLHAAAGTTIAEVRDAVASEGWELPLDSPGPASTVGGTISTGIVGPRAHAFGAVKDAVLGLEVVGADGVATKCGGRVVKNVTGYDLAKLYCGSHGSLAIITGAWLRLRPAPADRFAFSAAVEPTSANFETMRRLGSLSSMRALVWEEGGEGARLIVELGGSPEGVAHDRGLCEASLAGTSISETSRDEVDRLRDDRARIDGFADLNETLNAKGAEDSPVAVRGRVLGSRLDAFRRLLREAGFQVSIDLGLGVARGQGRSGEIEVLQGIRSAAEAAGGFAVFEAMPRAWRAQVDVFGSLAGTDSIVRSLSERFDPSGTLCPERFVNFSGVGPAVGVAS